MVNNDTPELWERQPDESVNAFAAFAEYRNMGDARSYAKVAQKLSKSETIVNRWGGKYNWVSRIEAWTDEQDRITLTELTKGKVKMAKLHTEVAEGIFKKAASHLLTTPVRGLSNRDAIAMLETAAKLERLSRGDVTERTEGKNEISGGLEVKHDPYGELTVEELRGLLEIEKRQQPAD